MINKKKSCVIIGLGRMGERYIQIAKKLHLNIVGTHDKNIKNGLKISLKNKLHKKIFFSNIVKILELKPDIAIIASTADSHLELIKNCSKYNIKKIMVEKPLTTSLLSCKKIEKLAQNKNIKICVNHSSRFSNQFIYLKNILTSNNFGKLKSINYLCGNIGLTMNGCHYFDFFKFLTGTNITNVMSFMKKDININPRGKKFEEFNGQILVWNKQGTRGYIDASEDSHHGQTLTCICKYGIIFMDLLTGNVTLNYRKPNYRKLVSTKYASPFITKKINVKIENISDTTQKNLKEFINNKKFTKLIDGISPVKILIAAITSSKNKNKNILIKNLKNNKDYKWA